MFCGHFQVRNADRIGIYEICSQPKLWPMPPFPRRNNSFPVGAVFAGLQYGMLNPIIFLEQTSPNTEVGCVSLQNELSVQIG